MVDFAVSEKEKKKAKHSGNVPSGKVRERILRSEEAKKQQGREIENGSP